MSSQADELQDLLRAADRSAPCPPTAPISIAALEQRTQQQRVWRSVAALVAVLAAFGLWQSAKHALAAGSTHQTETTADDAAWRETAAAAQALEAGAQALLAELEVLRVRTKSIAHSFTDTADLAIERAAMASFACASARRQSDEPSGTAQLAHLRDHFPSTQGGQQAARLLNP